MKKPAFVTTPVGDVRTTSTVPAACAGVVTTTDVAVLVPSVAAVPPNVTEVVPVIPEPVRVTEVFPTVVPTYTEAEVIVGAV